MVAASPDLIGRDQEVTRATAVLDAACAGRGGLLHLHAGPGLGKSALASEVVARAEARGMATAWGRPLAGRDTDVPYGTWIRALERLGGSATSPAIDPSASLDRARAAVLAHVDRGPALLVLDDVHRADPRSRWLVEHLLDDLEQRPTMVLVATEPVDDADVEEDLRRWRSHRSTTRVLLSRLGAEDAAGLLSRLVGEPIGPHHPLVVFADGSPAQAADLAEEWQGEVARSRIVSRVATLVESHNVGLVLTVLSALGRPATEAFRGNAKTPTIGHLVREPAETVIERLHAAAEAGIVQRVDAGRWAMAHEMFADAALSDPVRTARVRRRIAESLMVIEAEEGSGVVSAECAGEFILAGDPDPEVSLRAARWYLATGDPAAARALVRATLTTALAEEHQIALNRQAGKALAAMADWANADDHLQGMVNRARVRGLDDVFVDAVADLLVWLPTIPDAARLGLVDEALDRVDGASPATQVRLHATAAHALVHVDPARSAQLWARATDGPWDAHSQEVTADVLALPAVHGTQADLSRTVDAVRVLEGLDGRFGRPRALAAVGRLSVALVRGTRDEVERALGQLDAATADYPSPELAAYGAVARMGLARHDGDLDALMALSRDRTWLDAPPGSHAAALLGVGHLLWEQTLGPVPRLDESAARAARIDAPASRQRVELAVLGISALGNADLAGDLRDRLQQLGTQPSTVPRDLRWTGELVGLAVFAGAAGDVAMAVEAADLLEPHLDEMAVVLPTMVAGPVGLHVAHARMAAGDVTGAEVAITAALHCCERAQAPTWEAAVRLVEARVALVAGHVEPARKALAAATARLAGRSAPVVLAEAERLAAQVAELEGDGAGAALSEREVEVIRLVAGGATNRQIARSLGISPKTVEFHLAGVFRSLGAANRTEAVELARRARVL